MGGVGTVISAERNSDRYAGALALCPMAGVAPSYDSDSDYLAATTYPAAVTHAEFERSNRRTLLNTKISSSLSDPQHWL